MDDPRQDPDHPFLQMSRSRIFGIIAGYEDQNDHDALGKDPVFKLLADRLPDDDDLASQPTLSRFENAITPRSLLRLEEWFINRFVESFDQPPAEITLDIDVFDDPTHGQQQLTFYHGFYKQYQYLVRAITCAENDYVVLPVLLHGWVVVKCEANSPGTNRRAVVTNRPGAWVVPQGAYDEYAERGESENRNKELKCELCADRLSDHRYMANCFRMFLHCAAANLLIHMRRRIANPPLEPSTHVVIQTPQNNPAASEVPDQLSSEVLIDAGQLNASVVEHEVPAEAASGRARRQQFNRRRQADPLGEGHACTWRLMLIKVAARVEVTARRVRVLLSGSWPFLPFFRDVGHQLTNTE